MLQNYEALLVEVYLLTNSESAHQLIDSLSFLALALTDSLQINVWVDLNDVAGTYESTATGGSLEESRHHPRFMRPLPQSSLEQYLKLIGWLHLGTSTELILLFLSLEDEFEEESQKFTCLFHAWVKEHVEADIIVVAEGLQILSERLAHLELVCGLLEVLGPEELQVHEVVLLGEHL